MMSETDERQDGNHGGFYALVGYTQQMLGSAADFVRCMGPIPPPGSPDWEVIHSFEIETVGQDAIVVGTRLVLTQFKVALNPRDRKIGPADLRQIAESFKKSEAYCRQFSFAPIKRMLRSNRPLSPSARPSTYDIEFERYDPNEARREVEAYAARFGICEPAELAESIRRVIGEMVTIGAEIGSHRVTKEAFDKSLIGSAGAQSLRIRDAVARMKVVLDGQQTLGLGCEGPLVVRTQVVNAMSAVIDDAIVVMTGNGGSGKSVALWQILRNAVAEDSTPQRLAHLITLSSEAPETFSDLVDELRGMQHSHAGDTVAFRRIEMANFRASRPILLLGWDGIDQRHQSDNWMWASRRMIEVFWKLHQKYKGTGEPPPALLLVSCRRPEEFKEMIETTTGLGVRGKEPVYIDLDVFTDSELLGLLQMKPAKNEAVARLCRALERDPLPSFGSAFPSSIGPDDVRAVECTSILRQPIIWNCFEQLGSAEQLAFLNGDLEGFASLSQRYLEWFIRRARQRHGIAPRETLAALEQIATHFPTNVNINSTREWHRCALDVFGIVPTARKFYDESVSSGLIDETSPGGGGIRVSPLGWRWRHDFVARHLVQRMEVRS